MAYTLYWWHPNGGVRHMTWDRADQVTTHIQSIQNFQKNWGDWAFEYYSFDNGFSTWWYYCKDHPSGQDPWQRRLPDGIPKEIRAYHLLLG